MNKQVEQIKAEIERRIREDYNGNEYEDYIAQGVCASMLYYINYLEEETVRNCEICPESSACALNCREVCVLEKE